MEIPYRDALKVVRKVKRAQKTAAKVLRKLKEQPGASYQQRQSWKYHLARLMKLKPTKAESILDAAMKDSPLITGHGFTRQAQIGPYIADFCIENWKLAIEADGAVHNARKQYDAARDQYMCSKGYMVLRFTNAEITSDVKSVIRKIETVLWDRI